MSEDTGDKTEEPTQRRLDKAVEDGSVAKSQETVSFVLLLTATLVVALASPGLMRSLSAGLRVFFEHPHTFDFSARGGEGVVKAVAFLVLRTMALPMGLILFGALAGHLFQHKPTWSTKPLEPKLDKLSPIKGFGRLFGAQGWFNFVKALLKLGVIGGAAGIVIWSQRDLFLGYVGLAPEFILPSVKALVVQVLIAVLSVLAAIALVDLIYQRFTHHQKMKMTRKEVKDEHKDSEGDPLIKAKIRQLRQERARRRMMAAVPGATVIVTNPTHYAVALKYEEGEMAAPICVAKGMDETALRIRMLAKEHNVPIVENPPLARALHATVDLEEVVPQEHFKAVAEVIGYVLKLKNRRPPLHRR